MQTQQNNMHEILGSMNILGIATGICTALLSKYKRRHFEHERVIKKKIKMNLKILECKLRQCFDVQQLIQILPSWKGHPACLHLQFEL
jgi:hypothetical protein